MPSECETVLAFEHLECPTRRDFGAILKRLGASGQHSTRLDPEQKFSRSEQPPSKLQKRWAAPKLEDCCNFDNDAWTLADSFQTFPE